MKKIYLWIIAVLAVFVIFSTLAYLLKGVTNYIVKQYEPEYLTPSHKDSLYMGLLQQPDKRLQAMKIAQTTEKFYFLADSTTTILEAKIAPEYIADIVINKGLANDIRSHLLQLDTSSIVPCSTCIDYIVHQQKAWIKFFKTEQPTILQTYLQEKILCVDSIEQRILEQL